MKKVEKKVNKENTDKSKKIGINKIILVICAFVIVVLVSFIVASDYYLSPVDKKSDEIIKFEIKNNTGKNKIADDLENAGLIKNATVFKIYIKLNKNKELYAGTYNLSKSMSVNEIIDTLHKNKSLETETVQVTFIEGKRLADYAKVIENNFDYKASDVIAVADSDEFVNKMISTYDFITDEVKQDGIYHPLEGYLFADTYDFKKNSTIEEILNKMIYTMGKKLEVYKDDINVSKFSVHELLTLASIVELEGANSDDRAGVAGVFYNRIEAGWTLGSDATTYYAVNKDFSKDLTNNNLKSCNKYNTRSENTCSFTGLPIGPIDSPSLNSINAVMEPEEHDYYYFVADKNKKTYFASTYKEHTQIVAKLRKDGLWYEY